MRLVADGETAVGVVQRLYTTSNTDFDTGITDIYYNLTYQFETELRESHQRKLSIDQSYYQQLSEGEPITITYLPNKPRSSRPEAIVQPQNRVRVEIRTAVMPT